ncbi:MAG: hypothetical protein MJ060_04705, partial [Clostridia bacterium]|nr:hypothetical protein [Clostridia bacterium]
LIIYSNIHCISEMSNFIESRFCFIQLDVQPQYRIVDEDLAIKQKADFTICIDHHPKEEPNCNLVYVDKSAAANALNV